MKLISLALMMLGMASFVFGTPAQVPEISPTSATSGLALLSGAVMMFCGRRKK